MNEEIAQRLLEHAERISLLLEKSHNDLVVILILLGLIWWELRRDRQGK